MIFPLLLLGGGAVALIALLVSVGSKNHQPDSVPTAGRTGWKRVDVILGDLKAAAVSSGIPLGLLVGWVAKESGGKLADTTSLDERGYFQLDPRESAALGLDHQRIGTDSVYSINAGLALIGKYMGQVDAYGVAQHGTAYYWALVKLIHSMGAGAVAKLVAGARAAGEAGSWESFKRYALALEHVQGPQPKKWIPFVDSIIAVGQPFGFGEGSDTIVGGGAAGEPAFDDIPDILNLIPRGKRT